jgi:hypothetical protein
MAPGAALAARGEATAAAAGHGCKLHTLHNRLGAPLASVLSVRGTSCHHATKVIRRYGKNAKGGLAVGKRFTVGGWKCRTYLAVEEDFRARCSRKHRAFRVDYGA